VDLVADLQQTIFIVDDDEAIRDALGMLLDSVGLGYMAFASATEFLESHSNSDRGCLVLDIRMPGMSGLELQQELQKAGSSLPVIFITGHGDIPLAVEAMRNGAVDFIRKPFREQELLDRIHEALDQEAGERQRLALQEKVGEKIKSLTDRESEVFQRIAKGEANKVVALEMGISERTVEVHRANVMKKLGVRSLADLVRAQIIFSGDTT